MGTFSVLMGIFILIALQRAHFKLFISMGLAVLSIVFLQIFKSGFDLKKLVDPILIFLKDSKFYEIVFMIYLIYVLGEMMKNSGATERLKEMVKNLFEDPKLPVGFIPMIIGLMPMPGGAMFTAPIVKPMGEIAKMNHLEIAVANYWFRHTMEFFWLVYPAMLIASSFAGISLRSFMLRMFPTAVGAIIAGLLMIKVKSLKVRLKISDVMKLIWTLFPILVIIALVLFGVRGIVAVSVSVLISTFIYKDLKSFVKGFKMEVILLISMIFIYKAVITSFNLSRTIALEMTNWNIPSILIAIAMPFILGLMTGITQASVGMSFPTIFALQCSLDPITLSMISYFSAVMGVLLSPAHLCLALSAEYFGVGISKMLKKLGLSFIITSVVFMLSLIFSNGR